MIFKLIFEGLSFILIIRYADLFIIAKRNGDILK